MAEHIENAEAGVTGKQSATGRT